jgi:hypothetical protein
VWWGATPVIFQSSWQVSIAWFDIATTFHAPETPKLRFHLTFSTFHEVNRSADREPGHYRIE